MCVGRLSKMEVSDNDREEPDTGTVNGVAIRPRTHSHISESSYTKELESQYCGLHYSVFCRKLPGRLYLYEFPLYRQVGMLLALVSYLTDIGLDVWVAVLYLQNYLSGRDEDALKYFIATVFFIVVPSILIQFVSWFLYFWSFYLCKNTGPSKLKALFGARDQSKRRPRPNTPPASPNLAAISEGGVLSSCSGPGEVPATPTFTPLVRLVCSKPSCELERLQREMSLDPTLSLSVSDLYQRKRSTSLSLPRRVQNDAFQNDVVSHSLPVKPQKSIAATALSEQEKLTDRKREAEREGIPGLKREAEREGSPGLKREAEREGSPEVTVEPRRNRVRFSLPFSKWFRASQNYEDQSTLQVSPSLNPNRPQSLGLDKQEEHGQSRRSPNSPYVTFDEDTSRVMFHRGQQGAHGKEEIDMGVLGPKFLPLETFDNKKQFALISLLHILHLGLPVRIIRLLWNCTRDPFTYFRYYDISFIRLMESFLESAPQALLQLYLVQVQHEPLLIYRIITPLSIIWSFGSLAFAVSDFASAYVDILAYIPVSIGSQVSPITQEGLKKERLSWTSYFIHILWQIFMISSRGIAIALFAGIFSGWVLLLLGIHYTIMVAWMFKQTGNTFHFNEHDSTDNSRTKFRFLHRYCIEFLIAGFNIFFYFSILDESTERNKARAICHLISYHILIFTENTILVLVAYMASDWSLWYSNAGLVSVFVLFAFGILAMLAYHLSVKTSKKANHGHVCDTLGCKDKSHAHNDQHIRRFTGTMNWFFDHEEVKKCSQD